MSCLGAGGGNAYAGDKELTATTTHQPAAAGWRELAMPLFALRGCGGPGRARAAPGPTRSKVNETVAPIHPKAVPVLLTTLEECEI